MGRRKERDGFNKKRREGLSKTVPIVKIKKNGKINMHLFQKDE